MKSNKILKPKTGAAKINKIATFDIETANWVEFLILGFFDGKEYKEFYSIDDFLNFVCRDKYTGYKIYAHNAGKFDFLFLFDSLKLPADIYDINGRIFSIRIKLPSGKAVQLYDSYYILQFSLDKLIKKLTPDTAHKKIEIDFSKVTKVTPLLRKHLKNDCLSLHEILVVFQSNINVLGAELKGTSAATSMDLFTRYYLKTEIPTYFQHDESVRRSYFGGRNEVFKKHIKNGFYYDFNSLYPAVMQNNYFPVGTPQKISNYRYDKNDTGFVFIRTKINSKYPVLPYKTATMLLYPNGNLSGFYSIEFLKKLQELNIPFQCFDALLFDREKLFSGFVSDLYALRMKNKNNSVLNYTMKLMLNSLYGKFAQKIKRKSFYFNPDKKLVDKKNLILYSPYYDIWYDESECFLSYILPAISSYVTGYAQLKLSKYINDNTYYIDTDSIITTEQLPVSGKIGDLKLEDIITDGIFITQKVYAYKNEKNKTVKRAKGFTAESIKKITFENYKNCVYNNDYAIFNVNWEQIYGWRESLCSRNNPDKILKFAEKKKSIRQIDTKRKFLEINKSVPFEI